MAYKQRQLFLPRATKIKHLFLLAEGLWGVFNEHSQKDFWLNMIFTSPPSCLTSHSGPAYITLFKISDHRLDPQPLHHNYPFPVLFFLFILHLAPSNTLHTLLIFIISSKYAVKKCRLHEGIFVVWLKEVSQVPRTEPGFHGTRSNICWINPCMVFQMWCP